jgi:IS30 family transposase
VKKYTHLTEAQRYYIYLMIKQGFSLRFIAKTMGRSVSTISRELKRNTGKRNYRPKQAHDKHNKDTKRKTRQLNLQVKLRAICVKS